MSGWGWLRGWGRRARGHPAGVPEPADGPAGPGGGMHPPPFPAVRWERPEQLPPLALAYIGDAVYELYVRQRLLESGHRQVGRMHAAATGYVRAQTQARAMRALQSGLTPLEQEVARRGRNAAGRGPRSGDPADYAQATAFEAVVGYLYLSGNTARLKEVLEAALEAAAGGQGPAASP